MDRTFLDALKTGINDPVLQRMQAHRGGAPAPGLSAPLAGSDMDIWNHIIGNLPSKMAEMGVPPPPSMGGPNVAMASPRGAAPQGTPQATAAGAPAIPLPATNQNISQFDLMTRPQGVQRTPQPGAPMILPGAPGSPEDVAAALTLNAPPPQAKSPSSEVKAPEAPKGVIPSTPSVPQMRDVNLDPMMQILQQIMASGRGQPTNLPQLSAYLQRRPQS